MRRSWAGMALVIPALLMSAAGSPLASQTSARVRRIAYAPNLPLAARLPPADVTVVVEPIGKGEEVVYEHQPTQRQVALELLGSTAAFVMRVSAAEVRGASSSWAFPPGSMDRAPQKAFQW